MENTMDVQVESPTPKWKPLNRTQRRAISVLVEKAKTTPSSYPLSLNAITTGSNQKSNRDPKLELTNDDVEIALDELREAGAVGEVHGDGRVIKYRHYMKDWLGVDGTELAVMAELLLRGAQTIGELRGRAARMANASLPDVAALQPVIRSLVEKGLVIPLTAAGRGQVITHRLYTESEFERIQAQYSGGGPSATHQDATPLTCAAESSSSIHPPAADSTRTPVTSAESMSTASSSSSHDLEGLRTEVEELRAELSRLKKEVNDIWSNIQ